MQKSFSEVESTLSRLLQSTLEQTLSGCQSSTSWSSSRADSLNDIPFEHCIVLTISSFKFKLMCLLHMNLDEANHQFVAEAMHIKRSELQEDAYSDYLLEMSNSLCGTLKRHMQSSCPPLGMSTPNFLHRTCLSIEYSLAPRYSAHARCRDTQNNAALFAASLLVFSTQPEDFQLKHYKEYVKESNDEADASGELELF
jgi:hypothetical protein